MSNLSFLQNSKEIYRPLQLLSSTMVDGEITLSVYNTSATTISNAGVFLSTAKNLGDVDNLPDSDSFIDYNNLLTWGTESLKDNSIEGGLKLVYGSTVTYFSYVKGSNRKNKIPIGSIDAGNSITVKLVLEVPPGVSSRRLYILVNVE